MPFETNLKLVTALAALAALQQPLSPFGASLPLAIKDPPSLIVGSAGQRALALTWQ